MNFKELQLIDPILKALETTGYTTPTPIQAQAIPFILDKKDVLGCAQTGTGKTAAFAIPIIQMLANSKVNNSRKRPIRALVLTPTRELAIQIEENFKTYGKELPIKSLVIFGGVGQQPQVNALRAGIDVLIATPGRLLDLINQGFISLKELEYFVLDEADRMLDMGFIHEVKRLVTMIPKVRQTLFFSATMPAEIQGLANTILKDPIKIEVTPESTTVEKINQSVYFVAKTDKRDLLFHVLKEENIQHVLIFSRTKHGADRIVRELDKRKIRAAAIHGNKSQNARQRALKDFKDRRIQALVATDIAARGIDIDELAYVINYDLPNIPESYVHRIGRTGRAGLNGVAISFCDHEEYAYLLDIQKVIRVEVPVEEEHPYALSIKELEEASKKPNAKNKPAATRKPFKSNSDKSTTTQKKKQFYGKRNFPKN